MKKLAFIVALLVSVSTTIIALPARQANADWLTGYDMAKESSNLPENEASSVVFTVLQWLLLVFTFLSVIAFVITGIMFLSAGSNPKLAEQAKSAVMYSIVGIAVGLSGYIVIAFVDSTLRGVVQEP